MTGYYQPPGRKRQRMVADFVTGAQKSSGVIAKLATPNIVTEGHTGVFFGVDRATLPAFLKYRDGKWPFIYIDNCYLGPRSETYRVTNNFLMVQTPEQHPGADSGGQRWEAMKVRPRPWRKGGSHILLCLQSELYFELLVKRPRMQWIRDVTKTLRRYTDRPIVIREKPGKALEAMTRRIQVPLDQQLEQCHAVVTWNSTAALYAMLRGVPAFCLDKRCSFKLFAPSDLSQIENPLRAMGRIELFRWLADNQWSTKEIKSGQCWSAIRDQC